MPNKRKKGKKLIGGYMPEEVAEAFKMLADSRKQKVSDLLATLVREELNKNTKAKDEENA